VRSFNNVRLDARFFEAPQPQDFCTALTAPGGLLQGSVDQSAVIRVLLREALFAGVVSLETEQVSSGSEGWMSISIDFKNREIRSLSWVLVRGHNDWTSERRWPWNSLKSVFEPWSEFVAKQEDARDLVHASIESNWQDSAMNAGILQPPTLLECNFADDEDPVVRRYLECLCDAFTDYNDSVLWGVFQDEDYVESIQEAERLEVVRTALCDLVAQLGNASLDTLIKLSNDWGMDCEISGAARWTYSCRKPFPDAMVWDQLPWEQQKFVLESCDPWVVGLACSLPDTHSEIIEWAATFEDEFVAHVVVNRLSRP
jgi:hypothetical protein